MRRLSWLDEHPVTGFRTHAPVRFVDISRIRDGFRVAVSTAVGSASQTCCDYQGHAMPVPEGAAHLLEHVLTARFHDQLWPGTSARTTPDRMTWIVDSGRVGGADTAADAVHVALAIATAPIEQDKLDALIRQEARIISAERAGAQNLARAVEGELLAALFPGSGLTRDEFGDLAKLESLNRADVEPLLAAVRGSVSSITVLGAIDDDVRAEVLRRLVSFNVALGDFRWRCLAPMALAQPPEELRVVPGVSDVGDEAFATAGVRLPGLQAAFPDRAERARQLVLGEALARGAGLPWLATAGARVFASTFRCAPWLEAADARGVLAELRASLRRRLDLDSDRLHDLVDLQFGHLLSTCEGWMELASWADLHEIEIDEIKSAIRAVDTVDVERLRRDLDVADGAVAYAGPELG
jgi:hypothetical protein